MKFFSMMSLVVATTLTVPAAAEWTKAESHEYSAKTSLKIVEPAHAKVYVTINGEQKEDSLPAIFTMPDHDAFVQVKVVAEDGDVWQGKVEVKAHKQTVLNLKHTAKASAPAAAPAHKMMGRVINTTNTCQRGDRVTRFVFIKDGAEAASLEIPPGRTMTNVQLLPGTYSVRLFRGNEFVRAIEKSVDKDGFTIGYGCGA
jgi:hypothetical protein